MGRIRYAFGGAIPLAETPGDAGDPDPDYAPWLAGYQGTGRRADLWVLACGGIAAAATFAAAFLAASGAHAATTGMPGVSRPAVVHPASPVAR